EPGVPFRLAEIFQTVPQLLERLPTRTGQPHVDQAVAERAAHQIFEGQVIDTLGVARVVRVLRANPTLDQPIAHGQGQGHVGLPFAVHVARQFGQRVLEVVKNALLDGSRVHAQAVVGQGFSRRCRGGGDGRVDLLHVASRQAPVRCLLTLPPRQSRDHDKLATADTRRREAATPRGRTSARLFVYNSGTIPNREGGDDGFPARNPPPILRLL